MLTNQTQGALPYKCGFCGFLYKELHEAEECELRCVSRQIEIIDERERAVLIRTLQNLPSLEQ